MRYYFYRTGIEFLLGVLSIWFFVNILLNNLDSLSLIISTSIIISFAAVLTAGSIRQLTVISRFDVNRDVVANQTILAELQTRFLFYLRISILQIPLFLAYIVLGFEIFFNLDIWLVGDKTWLMINILLGVLLIPPVIFVFKKLTPANVEVPWVRKIVIFAGGDHLLESMFYLNQIREFQSTKTSLHNQH